MAEALPGAVPPAEAIRFFEDKGFRVGFAWQDVWQAEHAYAFTVAKAMELDLLRDIRDAVDRAIAEGTTFAEFQHELRPLLQARGWWGRREMTDPLTGLTQDVQLGSPRRLRTIFGVNLRMAYAAGRWRRIEEAAARRPYLRYVAVQDLRTRPEHMAWHGTVLRWDDPWWSSHYPPNGWNCRCRVQQLSARDLERLGLTVSEPPPGRPVPWLNRRTGETIQVPDGIDPGFGYNVGIAGRQAGAIRTLIAKGVAAPADIAAALVDPADPAVTAALMDGWSDWVTGALDQSRRERRVVGLVSAPVVRALAGRGVVPRSAGITVLDLRLARMVREAKRQRGQALSEVELRRLPELLARPQAVLRDRRDGDVLYIFDTAPGTAGKLVVRVDMVERGREPVGRQEITTNGIVSGGTVEARILRDTATYELLHGDL